MSASITATSRHRNSINAFLFVVLSLLLTDSVLAAGGLTVSGWPFSSIPTAKPGFDFGDDPLIGRQICPPLTRLNLKSKSSEGVILRRIVEEVRGKDKGSLWRLELRSGIFWWNGEQVTTTDIAKSLSESLAPLITENFKGVFPVPTYEITTTDAQIVTIDWKSRPPFGPYVFNGMPLFRLTENGPSGLKYECAGNYQPESLQPLVLVPSKGYPFGSRLPKLKFVDEVKDGSADIAFTFSNGPGDAGGSKCDSVWPSPFFSIISWNLSSGRASKLEMRKLMTGLIPRKEIVDSGVLKYSDVVSAPIPRTHPGFNSKAADMEFNATKVSTALDDMGFKRKKAHATRTDTKGKELKLSLVNNRKTEGLVEKLISDSFSSVGLEVDFVESESKVTPEVDGNFTPLQIDLPRIDFLLLLHPKVPATAGFWKVKDEKFLKQLEQYAVSLTTEKPDFAILASIHEYLAENQVFSVIAHHRACIKTSNVLRVSSSGIANGDPDWFRDLLF